MDTGGQEKITGSILYLEGADFSPLSFLSWLACYLAQTGRKSHEIVIGLPAWVTVTEKGGCLLRSLFMVDTETGIDQ